MKSDLSSFLPTASLAVKALVLEAELSPKPGLVDSIDNGSHSDMDINLFRKSAGSFLESFGAYLHCGYHHNSNPKELLRKIRSIGMAAEKQMFAATVGVNTHKGANFTFGLLLSAVGSILSKCKESSFTAEDVTLILAFVKEMCVDIIKDDFACISSKVNLTYGEKLYLEHGFAGIRAEAALGYPSISLGFSRLLELRSVGIATEPAYLEVLLLLMSQLNDTNLISRGGLSGLACVKKESLNFLAQGGVQNLDYLALLSKFNDKLIELNLSPGGSADILSAIIFLDLLIFGK